MRMFDLIARKRDGLELTKKEIESFVFGFTNGEIPDYQASALLMAVYFQGLSKREIVDLTLAMAHSGAINDLSSISGIKVDKHSTGGVGDTTTLILVPLIAACGVPVAKMSGRGLGHTGGTIDKLDSIPGFNTALSNRDFLETVNRIGAAMVGQTAELVPADKKLYALRDVTATIESIPLIASSIMSKKIASGANAVVLDVKTGSGAFMPSLEKSFELAKTMVEIGYLANLKTTAIITDMNQPLGQSIGNALEVSEAIDVLNGKAEGPLRDVSLILASHMLVLANKCANAEEAMPILENALVSGKAAAKLKEIIAAQKGTSEVVDDKRLLPYARRVIPIEAKYDGYIESIHSQKVGTCALLLGAGRSTKDDKIDPAVGLVMRKRIGDSIKKGEVLAEFHVNSEQNLEKAIDLFYTSIRIGPNATPRPKLVFGIVTQDKVEMY